VAKIREAVLAEKTSSSVNLPERAAKLRETYAEQKQLSKSRERKSTDKTISNAKPALIQNKYKRV
jgi:hypothetical protein